MDNSELETFANYVYQFYKPTNLKGLFKILFSSFQAQTFSVIIQFLCKHFVFLATCCVSRAILVY